MDKKYFFDILKCALEEREKPFIGAIEEHLMIFKRQSLLPYLYAVFKKDEFKKQYYTALTYDSLIDEEMNKVIKAFNDNKIKHVLLKGFYLKKLFPIPALRTMGDVDILIDDNDFKRVKKILLSLGYEAEKRIGHHCGFIKKSIHLEIHYLLMSTNSKYGNYFLEREHSVEQLQDYTYKLNDSYHLLFIIAHYAKHMEAGGAGIRAIIDIYLLLTKGKIDLIYVKKELESMCLSDFFDTIVQLIEIIFDYKACDYQAKEDIEEILLFILSNAPNGDLETVDVNALAKADGNKFKMYLKKVFIPYNQLKMIYPFSKFILLAPIAYFCYFCRKVFTLKRKSRMKNINNITQEEMNQKRDTLKKMGF